jgi:hypothetical protein
MLAKKIWDTLKVVDVSDHVEKKNGMSYLSWSFAWSTLMNHYPNTQIKYTDRTFQDGTVEYECTIRITDGEESVFQTMWLPVIDFRNKSVANPDAMARNTCKMRCLVKCISLFGLGINIYQGVQTPNAGSVITDSQKGEVLKLIETSGADLPKFLKVFDIIDLDDMPSEKYNLAVTSLKKKIKESDNDNA